MNREPYKSHWSHGFNKNQENPFLYPEAKIVGHRDFPNVHKDCPCLDVQTEYAELNSL